MTRSAEITRNTRETELSVRVALDGSGAGARRTGIGFFDHMLDLLVRHGRLDLEVTTRLAPAVVLGSYNNRYFFSSRVDPRSLVYQNVYTDWSIPALALK